MLTVAVLASLFDRAIPGFIDSAVMNIVSKSKREATFGKQRLFGSAGFGINECNCWCMCGSLSITVIVQLHTCFLCVFTAITNLDSCWLSTINLHVSGKYRYKT